MSSEEKPDKISLPVFFFHRWQDPKRKSDYEDVIEASKNLPEELAFYVRHLHSRFAEHLAELSTEMFMTTPLEADGESFTVAACFIPVRESGTRPHLRMLAAATHTAALTEAYSSPMAFVLSIDWGGFEKWQSFRKVSLSDMPNIHKIWKNLSKKNLVDLGSRIIAEEYQVYDDRQKAVVLNEAFHLLPQGEIYKYSSAFNVPETLDIGVEPALVLYTRVREGAKVQQPEQNNSLDAILNEICPDRTLYDNFKMRLYGEELLRLHEDCTESKSLRDLDKALLEFQRRKMLVMQSGAQSLVSADGVHMLGQWCDRRIKHHSSRLDELKVQHSRLVTYIWAGVGVFLVLFVLGTWWG